MTVHVSSELYDELDTVAKKLEALANDELELATTEAADALACHAAILIQAASRAIVAANRKRRAEQLREQVARAQEGGA